MIINVQTSTTYWKYNHNGTDSSVFSDGNQTITVANANGEFTLIPCLADGTPSGDITSLGLSGDKESSNQITSFDGTGLTSLTGLHLMNSQLTSFDGTGLTSLTYLNLRNNQLTSFDGTGLTSLHTLGLGNNQLTSFDGTDLTSLQQLSLANNLLTSLDVSPMSLLKNLHLADPYGLQGNPMTAAANDTIMSQFVTNGLTNGTFSTDNGRTSDGTADYNTLIAEGWNLVGLELVEETTTTTTEAPTTTTTTTVAPSNPTFITSKAVGQSLPGTYAVTTSGYWKAYHNGTYSSIHPSGQKRNLPITNANGEFTLVACDVNGDITGNITAIASRLNQIISFDGTGLTSLTSLDLMNNQLTSFDGAGLTSLNILKLNGNPLTSFIGGDMGLITQLNFPSWGITTLTSFDGTGLTSLTTLSLGNNQLTSFDGTDLSSLTTLELTNNQLTSFDPTGLDVLQYLYVNGNLLTPTINNSLLAKLAANELANTWGYGEFYTTGGRTSAGTTDYDYLIANGWFLVGLELVEETTTTTTTTAAPSNPTFITSYNIFGEPIFQIQTSTGYWKFTENGTPGTIGGNASGGPTPPMAGVFIANGTTTQFIELQIANSEIELFSCDEFGNTSGNIQTLTLSSCNITSFSGTGLTSLTGLYLGDNQLTSFDGTGLTSLTELNLGNNQLTSFDGTDLTSLTFLNLNDNQLTSFDGTGLTSLTELYLQNNQLTSFDGTGLSGLTELYLGSNQLTSFDGTGLSGLTYLYLDSNQLTSFDGTGLSNLSALVLNDNPLTAFDGTGLSSLTNLQLIGGKDGVSVLTSVTNLPTSLTTLELSSNQLSTFDGSDLINLTSLYLGGNQLTSFDGTDLTSLTMLNLGYNQLTSLSGFIFPTSLTQLNLYNNQLTSFDGTGLTSLNYLYLQNNQITSFDGTGLTSLTQLILVNNLLTSIDVSPMVALTSLFLADVYGLNGNPMTATANNTILAALVAKGVSGGNFATSGGRTSAGTANYDTLNADGWKLYGLDLTTPPPSGNGKLRIKGVNSGGGTTTTTTVPTFNLTFENGLSDQLVVLSYFTLDNGGGHHFKPRRGPGGHFGPSITEYGSMVTDENGQVVFNGLPNDGSNWKIDVYNTSLQDGVVVYTTGLVLEPDGPQLHEDTTLTRNFYNVDFLNQDDSGILSGKDVDIYYIPKSLLTMDVDIFPILMFSGTTDVNGTINTSLSDGSYIIRTYEDNGDLSWGQLFDVQGGTVSIYRPLSTDVEIVVNNLATTIWNNMVPTNNSPVEGIDIYYYDNSFEVYSFDPSQPIGNNNSQVIPPLTLLGQTDSNGQLSTNGTPVSIESGYIGVVWGSTDSESRLYSTGRTESLINDLGVNGNGVKTITLDTDINIRWAQWHPVINLSGKSVILSRFNGSEWVPFDSYTSIADSTNTSFGYLTGGVEYKLEVYNTQTTGDIGYSETWTPTWGESKTTNVTLS